MDLVCANIPINLRDGGSNKGEDETDDVANDLTIVLNGNIESGGSLGIGGEVVEDNTGVFDEAKCCDVDVTSELIEAFRDCVCDEYVLLQQSR